MDKLAKQQACQLFIEQEIEKGFTAGKTTYPIGKEVAQWIEKLFQAKVRPETIEERARRQRIATNVANDLTPGNQSGIQESEETSKQNVSSDNPPGEMVPRMPSENLYYLKSYWKKASKTDRKAFLSWIKREG